MDISKEVAAGILGEGDIFDEMTERLIKMSNIKMGHWITKTISEYTLRWACDLCDEETARGKESPLKLNYKGLPLYINDYQRIIHHYRKFHIDSLTLLWMSS